MSYLLQIATLAFYKQAASKQEVADLKLDLKGEHDAISLYQKHIDTIKDKTIVKKLTEIRDEERVHAVELNELLAEKSAASLHSANKKTYMQMLKRLYGGKEEAMAELTRTRDFGIYHSTKTPEALGSIMSDGIRANPGYYGTGAYVGDRAKSKAYGAHTVTLKLPSEASAQNLRYPNATNALKVSDKVFEVHKFDLSKETLTRLDRADLVTARHLYGRTTAIPDRVLGKLLPEQDMAHIRMGATAASPELGSDAKTILQYNSRVASGTDPDMINGAGNAFDVADIIKTKRKYQAHNKPFNLKPNEQAYGKVHGTGEAPPVNLLDTNVNDKEMHFTQGVPPQFLKRV